jgi:hypothetical protein
MIALKTDVLQNKIYPEISICSLVVAAIIRTCSLIFLLQPWMMMDFCSSSYGLGFP